MNTAATRFHLPAQQHGWLPSRLQLLRLSHRIKTLQTADHDLSVFVQLIDQINHIALRPAHRLVLAQQLHGWLRQRFALWHELAWQQESQKPGPAFLVLIHAIEALATNFKSVVAQTQTDAPDTLAPAILGALEVHVLWLRALMERYQEVPLQLWSDSHALLRIARDQGIALRAQGTVSGEMAAIQQIYIELALIGVIDAYRQSPGLLAWMINYLHRYAAALPLTPCQGRNIPVGADSLPGLFLIDLDSSQSPIAPWTLHANHPWLQRMQQAHCLVLDTRPLESLLPEHLRLLEEGEDPAFIHVTLAQLPKTQQRELLEQIWQALLPDSRENIRKEIWDQTVYLHVDFKEVCLRLRRRNDIVSDRTLSDQQLLAPTMTGPQIGAPALQNPWRLADISRTGMRIINDLPGEQVLQVGQLVAVESDAPSQREPASGGYIKHLTLLQVRWLRQNLGGGVQAGLRKLGDRPQAVDLHLDDTDTSITAIVIQHEKTDTLIIPASLAVKKGLTGRISNGQQIQKVRLGDEVNKSRHFYQVVYWELPVT